MHASYLKHFCYISLSQFGNTPCYIILCFFNFFAGFTNADCACCEMSKLGSCIKGGKTCPNRDKYVYFDGLHLTEAASAILATKACNSTDHHEVFVNLQKLTQV